MNDQATASNSKPPAGWYDSPAAQGQVQYWDGTAWTNMLRPKQSSPAAADESAQPAGATESTQSATPDRSAQSATADESAQAAAATGYAQSAADGYAVANVPADTTSNEPGFLQALFDTSFSDFVAIKFAKVVYMIGIGLCLLMWLGGGLVRLIGAATSGVGGGAFIAPIVMLLLGWIPALIYIIMMRIGLEFIVASVRTAQNTSIMAGTSTTD